MGDRKEEVSEGEEVDVGIDMRACINTRKGWKVDREINSIVIRKE